MVKELLAGVFHPLQGEGQGGARAGTLVQALKTGPHPNASRSTSPLQGEVGWAHHMPTATRTMTGQRITMNSTGKMHTIIGTASLAGRL